MVTLTIVRDDNIKAIETQDEAKEAGAFWDACQYCPVANAFARQFPNKLWLVNRDGAREAGRTSYDYKFSRELVVAIDHFDQHKTPIVGIFEIFRHKDLL